MPQRDETRAGMLEHLRPIGVNAAWIESGGLSDGECKALIAALKKLLHAQNSKGVPSKGEL